MRYLIAISIALLAALPVAAELRLNHLAGFGARLAAAEPPGGGGDVTLTYSSNGDTNGVMYYLGTNLGIEAWTNPHTAGRCTVVMSSVLTGTNSMYVNRTVDSNVHPNNGIGQYISFDLGAGRSLQVSHYSIQFRSGFTGNFPRNWKLQGSNDSAGNSTAQLAAATWTDIDTQVANTSIDSLSEWLTITISGTPAAYRWLRVVSTGNDSSGNTYLIFQEFEAYGELFLE